MAIGDWLRRLIEKMFPRKTVESKLKIQISTSKLMEQEIDKWMLMYANQPPWKGGKAHVYTLNLPAAIATELARLVLTEFSLSVSGSARGEYINQQLADYLNGLPDYVERWTALGGIAFKPYVSGDNGEGAPTEIHVDVIPANRFYPTAFNSNKDITGAVFVDSKHIGSYVYTRLEHHNLVGNHYTVVNRAFRSERLVDAVTENAVQCHDPFLTEVSLEEVEEWAALAPETELTGVEAPLFVYVPVPIANNLDTESPLGVSAYSRATSLIFQADRQYSRILWEYKVKEAAIFADENLFKPKKGGGVVLPAGEERKFRTFQTERTNDDHLLLRDYSPDIRDSPLFNGLNQLIRKVELHSGLAYGTFSDVDDTAKTATEIKMSRQRSYATVSAMQQAWERGIDRLLAAMDAFCSLYHLAPPGAVEKVCTWGDGVLEDTDVEYTRRFAMVSSGLLRETAFLAWYFGVSEEEAAEKYLPTAEPTEEEEVLDETEE